MRFAILAFVLTIIVPNASAKSRGLTVPHAPKELQAKATDSSHIELTWIDFSINEQGFQLERAKGADGDFRFLARVGAGLTEYNDSDVLPVTSYRYRVRAYNEKGYSTFTDEARATTPSAAVPTMSYLSLGSSASHDEEAAKSRGRESSNQ